MIKVEKISDNLIRTYSDAGMYIRQENGDLYVEAIDVYPTTHTYEETTTPHGVKKEIDTEALQRRVESIESENKTMSAEIKAAIESNQMLEDCVAEMAEEVYA